MKGNFSQAELELKAASHHPRLPLLCQARLLSSWCSKGACDTGKGLGGSEPPPNMGCFFSSQQQWKKQPTSPSSLPTHLHKLPLPHLKKPSPT